MPMNFLRPADFDCTQALVRGYKGGSVPIQPTVEFRDSDDANGLPCYVREADESEFEGDRFIGDWLLECESGGHQLGIYGGEGQTGFHRENVFATPDARRTDTRPHAGLGAAKRASLGGS